MVRTFLPSTEKGGRALTPPMMDIMGKEEFEKCAEKEREEKRIDEENARLIQERKRYSGWVDSAQHLYDLVAVQTLTWPTLTVEWLRTPDGSGGWDDFSVNPKGHERDDVHRIMYATHAPEDEMNKNSVNIAQLYLPADDGESDEESGDEDLLENPPSFDIQDSFSMHMKPLLKIRKHLEVNRARHMPQDPCTIACKTMSGDVHVHLISKHIDADSTRDLEMINPGDTTRSIDPDLVLSGHTCDGYGLDWSNVQFGHIASGSDDSLVCHWDIAGGSSTSKTSLHPLHIYRGHGSIVNDVQFKNHEIDEFASVGDDGYFILWDARSKQSSCVLEKAHGGVPVNALSFSLHDPNHFITASAKGDVSLWDTRRIAKPVHAFLSHTEEVLQIEWDPLHRGVFASCGGDKRVCIWDTGKIGQSLSSEESADDGPPELIFLHGGHTDKVLDLSWNPTVEWTLVSCAEDNIMHVWTVNEDAICQSGK